MRTDWCTSNAMWFCRIKIALLVLAVVAVYDRPARSQSAPTVAYKAGRLRGTNNPDINGLWQSLNEGNWDIQAHAAQPGPPQFGALFAVPAGPGIVEGKELPYQA